MNTQVAMKLPRFLPLHIVKGKWSMGPALQPLEDISKWIDIDEEFVNTLKLKHQLVEEHYSKFFAALPGSEAAQQEVLETLLEHLVKYFPEYYRQEGTKIENLKLGKVWDISDYQEAPLALAGQLVQEDLCIMQPGEEGFVLTAALAFFPLFWRVEEKIGLPLFKVHGPVPGFKEKLDKTVNNYFAHLHPDRPGFRIAWGIVPTDEMVLYWYQPKEGWEKEINADNAGDVLWLRTEFQTLRSFPKSGAVLFTIRSFVDRISCLRKEPQIAHNLAAVIRGMSPHTQTYRGMEPFLEPLLAYLDRS